ncbi:MAG: response regulator [Pseudomonadota bacterium]|nr:response regulator [Pseudomonadota bacterium]
MKVLVVDDDVVSRMVLMHLVDSCGAYEVYEAEDGEDAWEQLRQGLRPAICFCDLRMPRLSGMELLARVKADAALDGMRFVLASSANDHATMAQANSLGAGGYLVKPFEQDMVLAQMAGLAAHTEDTEHPLATMERLGIDGERLLVYLGGFDSQLMAAGAPLAALLAAGEHAEARQRIERLHAGCVTLGLAGAAARLDALGTGRLDGESLQPALAAALVAVREQAARVRQLPAL